MSTIPPLRRHDEILTPAQIDAVNAMCQAFGVIHTARVGFQICIHAYNGEWTEVEAGGKRFLRNRQEK